MFEIDDIDQHTRTSNSGTKQKYTPDPRVSIWPFWLKSGTSQEVIFLDDPENFSLQQLNFLKAIGYARQGTFTDKKDGGVKEIVTGVNTYIHKVKLGPKSFQDFVCSRHFRMRAFDRVSYMKSFGVLSNPAFVAPPGWYLETRVSTEVIELAVECANPVFERSIREVLAIGLGEQFNDNGTPCRFCAEGSADDKDSQNKAGRKIFRTIMSLQTYKKADGTEVKNPLHLFAIGAKADSGWRQEYASTTIRKQKSRLGLGASVYLLKRSDGDKIPSTGDGFSFVESLSPQEVAELNPLAYTNLTSDNVADFFEADNNYRYHLLRAASPKNVHSVESALSAFNELFPDGVLLANTAAYNQILLPKTPSHIQSLLGESAQETPVTQPRKPSTPVLATTAKSSGDGFDDVPF